MEKITAYEVIVGQSSKEISDKVNKAIDKDYQPYGYPVYGNGYIMQAMVKVEEKQ